MTLNELKKVPTGTYAALRVLQPANYQIWDFIKDNKIPVGKNHRETRLHVTLVYSRNHLPTFKTQKTIHKAYFKAWDVFTYTKKDGTTCRCLVMLLDCKSLDERFAYIMSHYQATWDYPTYSPHITLTYNLGDNYDISQLPPFEGEIELGAEYSEDLTED